MCHLLSGGAKFTELLSSKQHPSQRGRDSLSDHNFPQIILTSFLFPPVVGGLLLVIPVDETYSLRVYRQPIQFPVLKRGF